MSRSATSADKPKESKVRIIPIQISRDHPSVARGQQTAPAAVTSLVKRVDDVFVKPVMSAPVSPPLSPSSGSLGRGRETPDFNSDTDSFASLPARRPLPKKQVKSFIVPKMRRMFEKSKSAEPEVTPVSPPPPGRKIKISVQTEPPPPAEGEGVKAPRGDGTESVSSFVVVSDQNKGLLALPANDQGDRSTSVSEWSYTGDENGEEPPGGNQKGFVNRCVSKVRNLVKQGSPPQN